MSTRQPGTDSMDDFERYTIRGYPRKFLRALLLASLRVTIGLRVEHVERVPPGPLLVVSNHLHNADPILIMIACPRPLHFMTKKEVFRVGLFRLILRWTGGFPVDRGKADRSAIRRAEAALERSIAVGIFPEGTRSRTRTLQKGFAGVGLLALRSQATVLPVAITGSERLPINGDRGRRQAGIPHLWPGHRGVRIRFGQPITLPRPSDGTKISADEATEIIMRGIANVLPPTYRGIYADPASTVT